MCQLQLHHSQNRDVSGTLYLLHAEDYRIKTVTQPFINGAIDGRINADHNSCAGGAGNQASSSLVGRHEEAGHMLILPENDANEKEDGRQACR